MAFAAARLKSEDCFIEHCRPITSEPSELVTS